MKLLEITGLTARYGAGDVLKDLDISVDEGEIVALLGANGAGKSTTLRSISGLVPHVSGSITLAGQSIIGMKTEAIARLGISHVPEGRRVFPGLTVRENILLGASNRKGLAPADDGGRGRRDPGAVPRFAPAGARAGLDAVRRSAADGGGGAGPDGQAAGCCLLDEPSLGLAPLIVQQVFRIIGEIRKRRAPRAAGGNRTPIWRCRWPIAAMCWKPAGCWCPAPPNNCGSDPKVRAAYLGGLAAG